MPTVHFSVPVYFPAWLHRNLRGVKRALFPPKPIAISLAGDRYVEWSFISAEMPSGPGKALDFGCGDGYMSLLAARRGYQVSAVDLEEQYFYWRHPSFEFIRGDVLDLVLPRDAFDLIINCSAVEHVGVAGRYGITVDQEEGDLQVMRRLEELLKPSGVLLMTAPCGRDAVMSPWHRVYGAERLPKLLAPFRVEKQAYWVKDKENRWITCERDLALNFQAHSNPQNMFDCSYALVCLVLRKGKDSEGRDAQKT